MHLAPNRVWKAPAFDNMCIFGEKTMANFRFLSTVTFLLAALIVPTARSQGLTEVSCLKPEQVQQLVANYTKLRSMFDLEGSMNKLREAQRKKDAIADQAADCNRRLNDAFSSLGAMLDDCTSTLKRYNALNRDEHIFSERLKTDQRLLLSQMEIERGQFPSCR